MFHLFRKSFTTKSRYIPRIWWRGGGQWGSQGSAKIFPETLALVQSAMGAVEISAELGGAGMAGFRPAKCDALRLVTK